MVSDLEIYRSAKVLIRQHGAAAPDLAKARAADLLAAGNPDGHATFLRIAAAAAALLSQEPPTGARQH
jgi:hypothetical protein